MSVELENAQRALAQGYHLLLAGDTWDLQLDGTTVTTLAEALTAMARKSGFSLVTFYTPTDGFAFATPDERDRFLAARDSGRRNNGGPTDAMAAAAALTDVDGRPPVLSVLTPLGAAAALRDVLRGAADGVAVIVMDAALALPAPEADAESRRAMAMIRDALAPRPADTETPSRVILVAPQPPPHLAELSERVPSVRRVDLGRPALAERLALSTQAVNGAFGAKMLDEGRRLGHARALARATDGFSAVDYEALRRESHASRVPAADPARLVRSLRSGVRRLGFDELQDADFGPLLEALRARVIGQDDATAAIVAKLQRAKFGSRRGGQRQQDAPRAKLLLLGPSGTGKTEAAIVLAETIFGSAEALFRIDCGELGEHHEVARLTGAPPGFTGHEQGGQLTERVRSTPMTLLLLDEVEKAHEDFWNVMLALLSAGRLTDGRGFTVDFRDTVIVMTSNVGANAVPRGASTETVRAHFDSALARWARHREIGPDGRVHGLGKVEVHGRLKEAVVAYDVLRPQHVAQIVRSDLLRWQDDLRRRDGVTFELDADAVTALVVERSLPDLPAIGARELQQQFDRLLDDAYAQARVHGEVRPGDHVLVDVANGAATVRATRPAPA